MSISRAVVPMAPLLRPLPRLIRAWPAANIAPSATRNASSKRTPVTDKSRILEKPTRFNPPSHAARRVRPRQYPGPDLDTEAKAAQATKRYPNMMPPEGTVAHKFLTNRAIHVWISLGVLFSLAVYSMSRSFLQTTQYRDQVPSREDWYRHPFQSLRQFLAVYKLHVMTESEKVAEKRRKKVEDAAKRKEFMRAHGVEPGFLTGSWMEKFGTVDAEHAREAFSDTPEGETQLPQPPRRYEESGRAAVQPETAARVENESGQPQREKKKLKMWFGIW